MDIKIGERLQTQRKKQGLSQEELADKLGVSRQAVSKWERGDASPDTDNLIALAKIYGCTIDELINGNAPLKEDISVTASTDDTSAQNTEIREREKAVDKNEQELDEDELEDARLSPKQKMIISIVCGTSALVATLIYFILGYFFNLWHPAWIVFMLIPIAPSLADAIVKKQVKHFAFPVFIAALYILVGFLTNLWHPMWILFLTIPIYYVIVDNVEIYKKGKNK